jgi:hypothetical protein
MVPNRGTNHNPGLLRTINEIGRTKTLFTGILLKKYGDSRITERWCRPRKPSEDSYVSTKKAFHAKMEGVVVELRGIEPLTS